MSQENVIFPTDSPVEECQIGSSEHMIIEEKVNNYCGLGAFMCAEHITGPLINNHFLNMNNIYILILWFIQFVF